jgi:hypothetical protein
LEVVTFATYVGYHFEFVGKANLSHFAKGRVWFFRSGGINLGTNPSALWARGKSRRFTAVGFRGATLFD